MIGIKGIAKKPITDATAIAENIVSGKVAYNNNGRIVGSLNESSVLYTRTITIPKGVYNDLQYSSVKVHEYAGSLYEHNVNVYDTCGVSGFIEQISSDRLITGCKYYDQSTDVLLCEGNFTDRTDMEPVGIAYTDYSNNSYQFIHTVGVPNYRSKFIMDLRVPSTITYYCKEGSNAYTYYEDTNYDYNVRVVVTDNYYCMYTTPYSGGWYIKKVTIPNNVILNIYFLKRRT